MRVHRDDVSSPDLTRKWRDVTCARGEAEELCSTRYMCLRSLSVCAVHADGR